MDGTGVQQVVTLLGQIIAYPHTPGIVGSLAALRWAGRGIAEKLFAFGFGLACALWVAPLIVEFVGMQTEAVPRVAALFAGAYGARVGDRVAEALHRIDIGAVLARLWPWARK